MSININKNTNTKKILIRVLDTVGDGTGTKDASGDYSAAAQTFLIKPPAHTTYIISRMIGSIRDGGSFDSGFYGNGLTLTNGIKVYCKSNGETIDLFDGLSVLTNADWAGICYDIDISKFGSGNEYLNFRWTFSKSGTFIKLDGNKGDELYVELHDDFTGLVSQYFTVQGYKDK